MFRSGSDFMNIWDVILIALIAGAFVGAVVFTIRKKKSGGGCCGSSCDGCSKCEKKE